MKAFDRQPPPPFWADRVCRFVDLIARGEAPDGKKLHDWSELGRTLATWFHETVRPAGEGAFCAYCDGILDAQSTRTIDHWVPQQRCPALALWWGNLFPACQGCQSAKGTKWSASWVRPDLDDVEAWIVCDLATGYLEPSDDVPDEDSRARVLATIEDLRLNRGGLRRERLRILSSLYREQYVSIESMLDLASKGPYRFLAMTLDR